MSLNVRYYFWILLVLCLISLLVPLFLRTTFSNGLYIGEETYRSLRLGQNIREGSFLSYDNLSYGGKYLFEERLWYFLISIAPGFMVIFLPILFGILSFIVFYLLVSEIKPELKEIASLILIISPTFIYFFNIATKYTAALFFILLGFYLFKKNKFYLSYFIFILSGLFSIVSLLIVCFIFLYYSLKKEDFSHFYILFFGFILLFLVQFYRVFTLGLPKFLFPFKEFTFSNFFSFLIFGFGNQYGIGVFMFFLALIGIYCIYNEKYKFLLVYLFILLLFLLSFYFNFILLFLLFLLSFFAAAGIYHFWNDPWKSDVFRFLTLVVIICGLLFVNLSFYKGVSEIQPKVNYFESISFLSQQEGDFVVLSDSSLGEYIKYAGKKTFIDNDYLYAPDFDIRLNDFNSLLISNDINNTLEILGRYKIEYILIDKNNKDYQDEKGILFILKNSRNIFVNLFENDEVSVWYNRGILHRNI